MKTGARGRLTSLTTIMDRLAKKASKCPSPVSCAAAARAPAVWWRNIWAEHTGCTFSDRATQSLSDSQSRDTERAACARRAHLGAAVEAVGADASAIPGSAISSLTEEMQGPKA